MDARGQTNVQDGKEAFFINTQPTGREMALTRVTMQSPEQQRSGDHVGKRRGQRHTLHGHAEAQHEEKVGKNVEQPREGKHHKRRLRVTLGAQNRGGVIGQRHEGHTQKIDPRIQRRQRQQLAADTHKCQNGAGKQDADQGGSKAEDQGHGNGGMHGAGGLLPFFCADMSRHHHVGAGGKSHEDVDDEIGQRRGGTNGAHRIRLRGKADHHHIRRVVQHLQQICQYNRNAEGNDLAKQRAVDHIHIFPLGQNRHFASPFGFSIPLLHLYAFFIAQYNGEVKPFLIKIRFWHKKHESTPKRCAFVL